MSKIKELKEDSWRIIEIFLNAKENFNYSYYLHKPETQEELDYLQNDRNLIFIRHSLWRLSIIELAKLFSDNPRTHKFSLSHFLLRLKPGGYYSEFQIPPGKISEWEDKILTEKGLISNIITLRDKIYAHTDPDKDNFKGIEIFFVQLEGLFAFIESIVKEIYLVAFEADLDLTSPTFERAGFTLVKTLAKAKRQEIDEIMQLLKK